MKTQRMLLLGDLFEAIAIALMAFVMLALAGLAAGLWINGLWILTTDAPLLDGRALRGWLYVVATLVVLIGFGHVRSRRSARKNS